MKIKVENNEDTNKRLDVFIKENTNLSRTYISTLIGEGYVSINNVDIYKQSSKIKLNDVIDIEEKEVEIINAVPENIPLDIIYEDDDILIVDKPRGMVVHPSNGHNSGTLVNAIMFHCKDKLSTINGIIRPGIVHRIDKDTSGILCICKNDESHKDIAKQFFEHTNIRRYRAIVKGVIDTDSDYIDKPIGRDKRNRLKMAVVPGGKEAKTKFTVFKRFKNYTYIECELYTGRTHQIRVHMKDYGYPVLGDTLYGKIDRNFQNLDGQILHAKYLELTHPRTKERMRFDSILPDYFNEALNKISCLDEK